MPLPSAVLSNVNESIIFIRPLSLSLPELSQREPEVPREVLPKRLDRWPPHQLDAGHEAHLHRHENLAPSVRNAWQEVKPKMSSLTSSRRRQKYLPTYDDDDDVKASIQSMASNEERKRRKFVGKTLLTAAFMHFGASRKGYLVMLFTFVLKLQRQTFSRSDFGAKMHQRSFRRSVVERNVALPVSNILKFSLVLERL